MHGFVFGYSFKAVYKFQNKSINWRLNSTMGWTTKERWKLFLTILSFGVYFLTISQWKNKLCHELEIIFIIIRQWTAQTNCSSILQSLLWIWLYNGLPFFRTGNKKLKVIIMVWKISLHECSVDIILSVSKYYRYFSKGLFSCSLASSKKRIDWHLTLLRANHCMVKHQ